MKKKSALPAKVGLVLFIALFSFPLFAQNSFTAEQWQEDLRFLQSTVHKEYSFLFKKTTAADFDKAVEELNLAIPTLQEHEIMVGLARIVASFKYGHTVLGYREGIVKYHQLPIVLYHYSDGIYLQGVGKEYREILGAKLLKIEGKPIEEVLKLMYPVIPAENEQFVKAYGIRYLTFPEFLHAQGVMDELKQNVSFTLEKDGRTFEHTLTAVPSERFPRQYGMVVPSEDWLESRDQGSTPLYLKNLDKKYYYEYLPDSKTVYVRQSQVQDEKGEDIPAFYAKVFDFIENNEVDKLILDVRLNGGGNNYKNKPVVTGIIKTDKINKPGKFMVIIGRRTFSACQNLVNELSNYTNAIFVGEPTAENINFYGDNRAVQLPNSKINAYLSFAWWQDKPQWENGPWLAPHIAVDMSFEQYQSNQDPVLEAALDFSDTTFIINPMGHLTALFEANKLKEVESEASRMIKDPNYRFFDFQGKFNDVGYRLMGNKRLEEALYIFGMNTQLFPDSANAWDSLAEVYWKSGDINKAKEYYNKAIQLDPNGAVGDNSRHMLKEMEQGR